MANRATISVHTKPETSKRLEKLASATRRSKSFLANDAIERYLAEEEAFVAAVEQGIADAKARRVVGHEEAKKWALSLGTDKELPFPKYDRP